MKKTLIILAAVVLALVSVINAQGAQKAPKKIVDFAHKNLVKYGTDPVIVKAVKEQNAKGMSLARIQEIDKKWMATAGIDDFMKSLMNSECGRYLQKIQKSASYYSEIFVMDNQGANVAMSAKTSDYWQGDEDKWIKSFKGGQGAIFIDDVKFDDSTQGYLVQVSFPVKDETGKVIGAITVGIDVEKFK